MTWKYYAPIQNSVVWVTWHLEFVHTCTIHCRYWGYKVSCERCSVHEVPYVI